MMTDKILPMVVVGLIALLVGSLIGLWIGATTEQHALVDIITRAEISETCRQELNEAVKAIVGDWEGVPSSQP
jgi:membrane protein DedA with SNARE-associated domain